RTSAPARGCARATRRRSGARRTGDGGGALATRRTGRWGPAGLRRAGPGRVPLARRTLARATRTLINGAPVLRTWLLGTRLRRTPNGRRAAVRFSWRDGHGG